MENVAVVKGKLIPEFKGTGNVVPFPGVFVMPNNVTPLEDLIEENNKEKDYDLSKLDLSFLPLVEDNYLKSVAVDAAKLYVNKNKQRKREKDKTIREVVFGGIIFAAGLWAIAILSHIIPVIIV